MTLHLPDIARTQISCTLAPLDWVGMQGIELPLLPGEPGLHAPVHARAQVLVDLPDPHVKGIHMSRLYRLLDAFADRETLGPGSLRTLLQSMVDSHADCGSTSARLVLEFDLLCRRAALVTPQLSGWRSYPVRLQAQLVDGLYSLDAQVTVAYSSTCPCSAALSRQLVQEGFMARFGDASHAGATVSVEQVGRWLLDHATLATPHSQRSLAQIQVQVPPSAEGLALLALIDRAEAALATPVQAAVKRADEQAFARLNGSNLMYVEDAARRLQDSLQAAYAHSSVQVRHLESLHPHDAMAQTCSQTHATARPAVPARGQAGLERSS